jgi:PHP domain/PHP-associated
VGKADLHVHTRFSDGVSRPDQVLELARGLGLNVVAITDHNTIAGATLMKKFENAFGVEVVVGEEVSTLSGHIVGLFLHRSIPRDLEPEETIRLIHKQGGIAIVPHPFAFAPRSVNLNVLDNLVNHLDNECRPDALEIMNGFPWNFSRFKQLKSISSELGLAMTGGSDSHGPASVGCIFTTFAGSTAADLRKALLAKSTDAHGHPWPALEVIRALGKDVVYRSRKVLPKRGHPSS